MYKMVLFDGNNNRVSSFINGSANQLVKDAKDFFNGKAEIRTTSAGNLSVFDATRRMQHEFIIYKSFL